MEKGTKGFRPGKKENKLGLRASDTAELIFEDCCIPVGNLLGKEGDGFIDAMQVLDGGRISIAALGLGMAQGAYEAALKYSKQRKQFVRRAAIQSQNVWLAPSSPFYHLSSQCGEKNTQNSRKGIVNLI